MNFNFRNIKPRGNSLSGIFHEIIKEIPDPVAQGLFSIAAPTSIGSINYIVNGAGDWASSMGSSYFEICFKEGFLFPTHYTIRGASRTDWHHQTIWEVYGYNHFEKDNKEKWTKLGEYYDKSTTICSDGTLCAGKGTSTFPLSNPKKKGFQYIRFIATESTGNSHIVTSGVDFYGSLINSISYADNRITYKCKNRRGNIFQYMIIILCS